MAWTVALCLAALPAAVPGLASAQDVVAPLAAVPVRGNPDAPVGGLRRNHYAVPPAQLHPLNTTDLYGNRILDHIYETLAETDVETLEHLPLLARDWSLSDDKLTYTFHLDPRARWQDGRPVTAEDVAFSFNVLFDPALKTRGKWQAYYSNFSGVEVVNERTVRFRVQRDHYRNFVNLASLRIVPRHGFPGENPNETPLAKQPMGSGPYTFEKWERGSLILLRHNEDYWGRDLPQNRGRYNQSRLLTKIIPTDTVALEAFKKGDLDVFEFKPEQWVLETDGPPFTTYPDTTGPLVKVDVQNKYPRPYRYVGWNLESPLFADRRVRWAMSHLFDRELFIDKFYHGLQVKAVGPFAANSRYSSPKVQPVAFSVRKALELLRAAGWADTDGDRVLDKDGRPFRFTIMTADAETSVKVLTVTKQNMRKAGVDMHIKVVDWSTLLALIDEYRFDAVMLGWTRAPWPDPGPLWHSDSAVKGGLNLVRYRNPEVDRLIEQGTRTIPDTERIPLFRRVHELIHRDQPYTFLTERNHQLIGYRAVFRHVKPFYAYDIGYDYWWLPQVTP